MNCVVKLVGGTVQAVAVFSDCVVLGLWLRGPNSVVKLLGGRVHSGWCRRVGWWHCASSTCARSGVHRTSSCSGICATVGVHRTVCCGDRSTGASVEHISRAPAVIETRVPLMEFTVPAPAACAAHAPWWSSSRQLLPRSQHMRRGEYIVPALAVAALAPVVEYIAHAPVVVYALRW